MSFSEENQISDGSNQLPSNKCEMWWESFASVVRKRLFPLLILAWKELFPSLVWGGTILITIWIYGYIVCNFSGSADELLKALATSLITLAFIGILILIVWKSDPKRRPYRFIVLGIMITFITMLVQSFSGELICSRCLLWGNPRAVVSCRLQVAEFWFGNKGFVWGIATALFGAAWNFWEQYKREQERRQRFRERINQLRLSTGQNPEQIQSAREWNQLRKELCNEEIRFEIKQELEEELDRIRKQNMEKWTHMILSWIDWRLFRKVTLRDDKTQKRSDDEIQERGDDKIQTSEKVLEEIQELLGLLLSIDKPVFKGAKCNQTQTNDTRNKDHNGDSHWSTIEKFINEREPSKGHSESQPEGSGKSKKEEFKKILDAILWMWREYDVLAREWVVLLIEKWLADFPKEKERTKKEILDLRNYRRLTRHTQIRSLFPELYTAPNAPKYDFLSPWPDQPLNRLSENVLNWLGKERANPFGVARAEWEGNIDKLYHYKLDVKELMEAHTMAWITALSGSGRTALARTFYTEWAKPMSGVFPLYMSLRISHRVNVYQFLMKQLLHSLVHAWGSVLQQPKASASNRKGDPNAESSPFNGPTAFLDLDYHEQRKVAQLLFWEMRSLDALWAWLASLHLDLTQSKEGKALKARLQFLLQFPPPLQLSEAWMMELASSRPVGLESTYVIIELDNDSTEMQTKNIAELASDLQKYQVYWKVIASNPSPSAYPSAHLSWSQSELIDMLQKSRDTGQVLQAEAIECLAQFIYEHADGLPREMMQLGNVALALRAKKEAPSEESKGVLTKKDSEESKNMLTKEDIEDAIAYWQKEGQHANL